MDPKFRCLLLVFLCLALSSSFAGQDKVVLKTVSQAPMGWVYDLGWENDRPHFFQLNAAIGEYHWVLFSPDGRKLLPQLGVALADPEKLARLGDWARGSGKEIVAVDSCLGLRFIGLDGAEVDSRASLLPVTDFHYSPDFQHWVVALRKLKKDSDDLLIVVDGRVIATTKPPLAPQNEIMMVTYSVSKGILRPTEYLKEFTRGAASRSVQMAFSPDSRRFALIYDAGKKDGLRLLLDGQEGPCSKFPMADSMMFSSDGRHLVYLSSYDRAKNTATIVYDGREVPLKGIGGSWILRAVGWGPEYRLSPDGRYIIMPIGHSSGFGDYKQRYRILDMQETQGPAWDEEYVDVTFSKDGSKHLIVEETPTKQQKVQGVDDLYFKVESLALSDDGAHSVWAGNFRGKWVAVRDGQRGKPYLEIQYLTLSPDGKHIAYAAKNDQKKWVMVFDETEWGPYDKIEEPRKRDHLKFFPDSPVFFSPDSQHAAVTVKQDKLAGLVVDGTVVASFKKMGTPVFSPDGKRTAVWASDGEKDFIVLDGKALPGFKEIDKWHVYFSPDGGHVAYKAKIDKQWFVVVDGTPGANGYEAILTTQVDRKGIVFSGPDSLYYVGYKDKMLYLSDEKIEAGPGGGK